MAAFADDLIVLSKGSSHIEAQNYANSDINKIETWARNNKVEFNENKSKVLLITKKKTERIQ